MKNNLTTFIFGMILLTLPLVYKSQVILPDGTDLTDLGGDPSTTVDPTLIDTTSTDDVTVDDTTDTDVVVVDDTDDVIADDTTTDADVVVVDDTSPDTDIVVVDDTTDDTDLIVVDDVDQIDTDVPVVTDVPTETEVPVITDDQRTVVILTQANLADFTRYFIASGNVIEREGQLVFDLGLERIDPANYENISPETVVNTECFCPQTFHPICGNDRVTYANHCIAQCNNAELHHKGSCGGFVQCICYDREEHVCGEDGITYKNICYLSCIGVEVRNYGACITVQEEQPTDDEITVIVTEGDVVQTDQLPEEEVVVPPEEEVVVPPEDEVVVQTDQPTQDDQVIVITDPTEEEITPPEEEVVVQTDQPTQDDQVIVITDPTEDEQAGQPVEADENNTEVIDSSDLPLIN